MATDLNARFLGKRHLFTICKSDHWVRAMISTSYQFRFRGPVKVLHAESESSNRIWNVQKARQRNFKFNSRSSFSNAQRHHQGMTNKRWDLDLRSKAPGPATECWPFCLMCALERLRFMAREIAFLVLRLFLWAKFSVFSGHDSRPEGDSQVRSRV